MLSSRARCFGRSCGRTSRRPREAYGGPAVTRIGPWVVEHRGRTWKVWPGVAIEAKPGEPATTGGKAAEKWLTPLLEGLSGRLSP